MDFPSLPSSFEKEEDSLLREFTIISGVSEVSRTSEAPTGVNSGIALSLAIEQDETRLSHTINNIETGLVSAAKHWLRMYKVKAEYPRVLRMVGTDLEAEIMDWQGTDIRSDDVIIETSAALSDTPAQRRQLVFELMGAGLFNDPETGRLTKEGQIKLLELLQLGHWEFAQNTNRVHGSRAERENRMIVKGALPTPTPVDDDDIHIEKHIVYRLGHDFEQANQASGGLIEQIFMSHLAMHQQRIAQRFQVQRQAQLQMAVEAQQSQHQPQSQPQNQQQQ